MEVILVPFLHILATAIQIYIFILIISIVSSWLIAFNVINTQNRAVAWVIYALEKLTEPVLRPIRRFMPNLGGIDLSPIVVFLLLQFLTQVIINLSIRI